MIQDKYIEQFVHILQSVRLTEKHGEEIGNYTKIIEVLVSRFQSVRSRKGQVFMIGNGGSAAIAGHMTADFMKNGGVRTCSLYDSAVLTCLGNDYGYEYVFSKQLEFLMGKKDLLVCISSSGNSRNILNAIGAAEEKKAEIITFTGFKPDNEARGRGDFNVYVPMEQYGMVESIHNLMLQQVVDILMLKIWEEK